MRVECGKLSEKNYRRCCLFTETKTDIYSLDLVTLPADYPLHRIIALHISTLCTKAKLKGTIEVVGDRQYCSCFVEYE
jgi:hypothetical protein